MDAIKEMPPVGTIYSVTVKRGQADLFAAATADKTVNYRATVTAGLAGLITLAGPGRAITLTMGEFNERLAPQIFAAYAPPEPEPAP